MKMFNSKYVSIEQKAEEALLECLRGVPFIEEVKIVSEPRTSFGAPDLVARVKYRDGEKLLLIETKRSGQPRQAREAVNQLSRYKSIYENSYPVFLAPYISPRSAEICSEDNVGYMDLAGNCSLSFGKIFIEKKGQKNPFKQERQLRSLYSPRATRVLRVLLVSSPQRKWKIQALAQEAQVSLGHAFNIKKFLLDREWIFSDKDGFSLTDPDALLLDWSNNYNFRRNGIHDYYSLKRPQEVELAIANACRSERIKYSMTGFSAAERFSPAVRYQRTMAYIKPGQVERVASKLGLKEVETGANVSLWEPYDQGVFYGSQEVNGVSVVTPVQAYLDIKGFRGRGEEAAARLLEEVIRPQW